MGLVEELEAKKGELLRQMEEVDRQAARVREQFEERLADLRRQRIPLEEKARLIDSLLQVERGE